MGNEEDTKMRLSSDSQCIESTSTDPTQLNSVPFYLPSLVGIKGSWFRTGITGNHNVSIPVIGRRVYNQAYDFSGDLGEIVFTGSGGNELQLIDGPIELERGRYNK